MDKETPSFGKSIRAALCGIFAFGMTAVASSGAEADNSLGVMKKNGIRHVNPVEASQLIEQSPQIIILDVRTPQEFNQSRIAGAINIDFYAKDFKDQVAKLDKDALYLVHCRSGARSGRSLSTLKAVGLNNITHMDKGFNGWQGANLTVTTN